MDTDKKVKIAVFFLRNLLYQIKKDDLVEFWGEVLKEIHTTISGIQAGEIFSFVSLIPRKSIAQDWPIVIGLSTVCGIYIEEFREILSKAPTIDDVIRKWEIALVCLRCLSKNKDGNNNYLLKFLEEFDIEGGAEGISSRDVSEFAELVSKDLQRTTSPHVLK